MNIRERITDLEQILDTVQVDLRRRQEAHVLTVKQNAQLALEVKRLREALEWSCHECGADCTPGVSCPSECPAGAALATTPEGERVPASSSPGEEILFDPWTMEE